MIRQLSLFGVEAATPAPEDLAGLLAGPGQVVRMGGTARVSVVVEDRWRAIALVAEMRARGLEPTCVSTVDEHIGVRTPYSSVLAPLATGLAARRGEAAAARICHRRSPFATVDDGRRLS